MFNQPKDNMQSLLIEILHCQFSKIPTMQKIKLDPCLSYFLKFNTIDQAFLSVDHHQNTFQFLFENQLQKMLLNNKKSMKIYKLCQSCTQQAKMNLSIIYNRVLRQEIMKNNFVITSSGNCFMISFQGEYECIFKLSSVCNYEIQCHFLQSKFISKFLKAQMKGAENVVHKLHEVRKSEVILTASTLPRESSPRVFKRRQDLKSKEIPSPQRKKKQPSSSEKDAMCYITMMGLRKSSTKETSLEKRKNQSKKSRQKKQPLSKEHRSSSSPDLNKIDHKIAPPSYKSPQNAHVQPKVLIQRQKKMIDKQVLEITELKQINKILNSQINLLKNNKDTQARIAQDLQEKINQLTLQLRDSSKTLKINEKEITRLRQIIHSNKMLLQQHEGSQQGSKQDLQKILNDINRQIEEIFEDEISIDRTHSPPKHEENEQFHGTILDQFPRKDLHEVVYELQSKIKYLEIEVAMLKKYKLDYERMEREWLISNNQLKTFKKKLIMLAHQTQIQNNSMGLNMKKIASNKTAYELSDSSISLEFSKDSNLQKVQKEA